MLSSSREAQEAGQGHPHPALLQLASVSSGILATGSGTAGAQTGQAPALVCPDLDLAGQAQCPAPSGSWWHLAPVLWALSRAKGAGS